jgi:hypothetical protein
MTKTTHEDLERRLRELFDEQHHAVTPSEPTRDASAPGAVVDLDSQRIGAYRRNGVPAIALAVTAAMIAVVIAVVIAVGGRGSAVKVQSHVGGSGNNCTETPPATYGCSGAIRWDTPQVHLEGALFSITILSNGSDQDFVADDPKLIVSGDPGDATRQTLELQWHEHDDQMPVTPPNG